MFREATSECTIDNAVLVPAPVKVKLDLEKKVEEWETEREMNLAFILSANQEMPEKMKPEFVGNTGARMLAYTTTGHVSCFKNTAQKLGAAYDKTVPSSSRFLSNKANARADNPLSPPIMQLFSTRRAHGIRANIKVSEFKLGLDTNSVSLS